MHTQAEEHICYLPMFRSGPRATERMREPVADHNDIREIIGEASMQPVGSAPRWRAVRTVLTVSAEHLEREERDILPDCLLGLTMSRRKELGRQWCAFVAAWRADATLSDGVVLQEAPGVGRGRRRFPGPPDHAV